jgi:hypothetical protein
VIARDCENGILVERTVFDRLSDPNEVLHDDPTSAEVQMADLAVPHLPLRQADGESRRIEQGAGMFRDQRVPSRSVGEGDRVPLALGTIAPSVEHNEDNRTLGQF